MAGDAGGPVSPAAGPLAGHLLADHRLVFVAGLHRSGTTPTTRLLGGHPQVSALSRTGVTEDEGQHLQQVYPAGRVHGGPGRFAFAPASHLTEASPLATPDSAARLLAAWAPYWDTSRPVLVEKSPPNLVMTRFLQALFPGARFVVVVRHPVAVALATAKWAGLTPVSRLVEHWLAAYEVFLADAPHLHQVHVVRYEELVADPVRALGDVGAFLDLTGPIPAEAVDRRRGNAYADRWAELQRSRSPLHRLAVRRVRELAPRVARFGYDVDDLETLGAFPLPTG